MSSYEVVGNHAVFGIEPGGTVDIDDDAVAERLVTGGHIAKKGRGKASPAGTPVDDATTDEQGSAV